MGKIAFVFPGQGSQSVGMLGDVADNAIVTDTFAEASSVLGYDLWQLVASDPEEKLGQTEFTQPALLTASVALWRLAVDRGIASADAVAGHSLGEYSALVAAEVIQFSDAVALVQKRGQFMQTAVPLGQGSMAAVMGLDDAKVISVCESASSDEALVQAANFNTLGQVVIAGDNAALEKAIVLLKEAGAKRAMPLAVSAPFHSARMKPAADEMAKVLAEVDFNAPKIALIQNVSADFVSDPENIRNNLVTQMYSAVLWTSTIEKLAATDIETIVECGPGKILSGMNRRIIKSLISVSINSAESLDAAAGVLS